jgi:ferredoxin
VAEKYRFELNSNTCIFCAACASVAPRHFFVDAEEEVARVTHQPESADEVAACRAAMINCPTSAIRERVVSEVA